MKVAIIGACPKSHYYSYKAINTLKDHSHEVYLVSPVYGEIEGSKTFSSVNELKETNIHTLTMYVSE